MEQKRILVVDDEPDLCDILLFNLRAKGYQAEAAFSAEDALQKISGGRAYDLLLLDVMMPGMSGFELAGRLKAGRQTMGIPVIFLTAKDAEGDKLQGFALGADDYVAKPFSVREVLARVRAVLNRTAPSPQPSSASEAAEPGARFLDEPSGRAERSPQPSSTSQAAEPSAAFSPQPSRSLAYEGLVIDAGSKSVAVGGSQVALTRTEYELLRLLMEHSGTVFSRQQLLDAVWPREVIVTERTVDVNIARLRKKLGRYGVCLVSRTGFGYSFVKKTLNPGGETQ